MNKREARKAAYETAIGALEDAIAKGAAIEAVDYKTPDHKASSESAKIEAEMKLIIHQLRVKYERFSDVG